MKVVPWFYPDKVSVAPGESVALHASSAGSPCTLVVSRVGQHKEIVAEIAGIEIELHPTPENADRDGCGWPEATRFTVGESWRSGYYDLELVAPDGSSSHHFVNVRRGDASPQADAVIILSTNTYTSYNYWGGRNSYADVEATNRGEYDPFEAMDLALGRLSRMRPFPQNQIAPPEGVPRAINYQRRGLGDPPIPSDLEWAVRHGACSYDLAACYLNKWEHIFTAWCERNGYHLDFLTDHDFESGGSELLSEYKAVFIVGHSEYWSANQRSAIETYTTEGGNLAVFSGNTCYWKVRWEDAGKTLVAHKARGEFEDPVWDDPATRGQGTHYWSHSAFGQPEATAIGLSFLYGGYHRISNCVSRGAAAYTIYNEQHWALEGTDLFYGDLLGVDVPLLGYENDGCPIRFDSAGLPVPDGGLGIPQNLEIIGFAPATIAEPDNSPYPRLLPREKLETLAKVAFGDDSEDSVNRMQRGHAVIASFKKGNGEVFNAGTTEWAHGLAAGDAFVEKITHNVFRRFGIRT